MDRLVLYPVVTGVDANPLAIFAAGANDRRRRHAGDTNGRLGWTRCDGLKRNNTSNKTKDRHSGKMTNTHAMNDTRKTVKALWATSRLR